MIEKKPERFEARAYLLGDRLDVRAMDAVERLAASPLTIRVGDTGYAVLFRYGAVVLFGLDAGEEMAFLATLGPRVRAPLGEAEVEVETTTIVLDPDCREGVGAAGEVLLRELGIGRLQIVADALAKSVFLAHYEARVSRVFDQVEPLAARMGRRVWARSKARELLRQMGDVLLVQHKMIGRVEVTEKPEITWEDPELECLCDRLQEEYDLSERDEALERKLELLYRTSESIHDLLQEKRSLRVEWYIVVLIAIEILISVYEMWHGR